MEFNETNIIVKINPYRYAKQLKFIRQRVARCCIQ